VPAWHERLHRQIVVHRETLSLTTIPIVMGALAGAVLTRSLFVDD
jgi:hypothetical protein